MTRLEQAGYAVYAPPNPRRGVQSDAQTVADFVNTSPGPVVLVGHSYRGFIITNAATLSHNAWTTIPSWAVVGTEDNVIPPAEQLFMAHRAGSHVVEVPAGHLSLITRPGTVADTVIEAARTVG